MLDKNPTICRGQITRRLAGGARNHDERKLRLALWRFLAIDYSALEKETLKGGSDEELLAWAFAQGRMPSAEETRGVRNAFMTKRGWRDATTQRLNERLAEIGLPPGTVQTMFEFIDLDEGRIQPE